ncbi:non-specific lipid transfer protein GPI-anchored 5-like [Cornus florida]|uniref:non-specific lipid transfer protein GPI-anchored 5-like n=1 Tax=Cornus florida TaxID=4283 RepID=UPI00289CCCEC|nr:non-specific lipid transfer protein GPI-anchored 5-like [Cornus florida]
MAHKSIEMGLVLAVLVTMLFAEAAAQSSSCTNVIISMSPCLNYITGNSSTPSSGCCTQLATVVRSEPQCLCQVLTGSSSSLGININQTQALALPGACNVQTPPISRCNAAASPADSPAGTPESTGSGPSGTGSKTVPTTIDSSDGTSISLIIPLQFFLLFIATFAPTFTRC